MCRPRADGLWFGALFAAAGLGTTLAWLGVAWVPALIGLIFLSVGISVAVTTAFGTQVLEVSRDQLWITTRLFGRIRRSHRLRSDQIERVWVDTNSSGKDVVHIAGAGQTLEFGQTLTRDELAWVRRCILSSLAG